MHTLKPSALGWSAAPIDWLRERVHTPQPAHWQFGPLTRAQLADRKRQEEAMQSKARDVERTRLLAESAKHFLCGQDATDRYTQLAASRLIEADSRIVEQTRDVQR